MKPSEARITKGFFDGIRPEPILTVSEWADEHRYLAPESAEPGRWRTSRTPFSREIMDELSSHVPTQRVIFMAGAQVSKTESGLNWLGYIIDNSPGNALMVMPTVETVRRNSKIRVTPMIEATPRLKKKILPARSRDSDNTIFSKSFPGGNLILSGANSASSLRSMPIRFLMLDEVDAYPKDLDGEGSPVELAIKRTATYPKRKIFMASTPTIEGASVIEREFLQTDQRYYYVPCPHCGEKQRLIWQQIKWEKGKPETAHYECEHCAGRIEEYHKTQMLKSEHEGGTAEWIAHAPENASAKKCGFHLSSLYSPAGWYSWEDAVSDWEDAQGDTELLKTFVNTVLGETWKEKGEAPPWESIYNRRETYEINKPFDQVVVITAGADVQKDRIEVEIVGWCPNKVSYSLDYRVLPGETNKREVWDKLSVILNEQFEREDGLLLPILMMGLDSGYNTQYCYDFVRRHDPSRVFAIKGQETQAVMVGSAKRVDVNLEGKRVGRATLYNVGVSLIKSELYGWLRQNLSEEGEVPPGYCHFPQYGPDYFKGITAERLEYKIVRGFKKYEWVKYFERNEPLDCRVYARAAAALLGMDRWDDEHWQAIENSYGAMSKDETRSRKKSGGFW